MTAVTARAPSVCGKGSGPLDGLSCLVRIPRQPPELGCADSHQTVRRWLPLIRTGPCPDMTKGTRQPYNCQSPPFEVSVSMSVATDPQWNPNGTLTKP